MCHLFVFDDVLRNTQDPAKETSHAGSVHRADDAKQRVLGCHPLFELCVGAKVDAPGWHIAQKSGPEASEQAPAPVLLNDSRELPPIAQLSVFRHLCARL